MCLEMETRLSFVSPSTTPGAIRSTGYFVCRAGIGVIRFTRQSIRSPWMIQRPIYLRVLRPVLEKLNRGDILYIHNRPELADVLARIAEQRGIRLVLHMHNSLLHPRSRKHIPALKDVPVVFCSEFLRKEVDLQHIRTTSQKTHVVYNGADNDKFRAEGRRAKSVPQIIFAGRLVPYKGVHVLMGAMRILQSRGVRAKCTIVGGSAFGGSRPTRYVRKLERTRPSNTELIGYRAGNEFASLLRRCRYLLLPFHLERSFSYVSFGSDGMWIAGRGVCYRRHSRTTRPRRRDHGSSRRPRGLGERVAAAPGRRLLSGKIRK